MDWKIFCNNIKEILELEKYNKFKNIKWEFDDKQMVIECKYAENKMFQFSYTKSKFLKDYRSELVERELSIFNEKYYEVPISLKKEFFPLIQIRADGIIGKEYKDDENNLKYLIDKPSEQFLLRAIELKIKPNGIMMLRRMPIFEREHKVKEGIEKKSIFDLLKMIYRDCITLKIYSIEEHSKNYFQNLIEAFIYTVNYNTDMGIQQTYNLENIREKIANNQFRNVPIEKLAAPKRIYKKELIEQYNMANISEDPFIKYLCYYHILENFYESVYKEEIIKIVKDQITLPSFSIKQEREIIKLVDVIKEKLKLDRENFDGNELEALELVIRKYIDINLLKNKLQEINSELVDYYDKQKVPFSQGSALNFNDKDNLYKNISKRIYTTRNFLVHYKSNDFVQKAKGIYRPFDDRKNLQKEVPLIRILAEEIILKNSDIL